MNDTQVASQDLQNYALKLGGFNDRGFVPFQFSSKLLQDSKSKGGIKGLLPGVGNAISEVSKISNKFTGGENPTWYEMWINPQKVNINRNFQQKRQHTAAAIVTYHYRPEVRILTAEGVCGWIAINPQRDSREGPTIAYKNPKKWRNVNDALGVPGNTRTRQSPRIFLQRLRDMAQEPMYYVDSDGIEHYNVKYIKIFTKQFPKGVVCEGYYTRFNVPEEGEDAQTIRYDFEFIIEDLIPVDQLKSVGGMFGLKFFGR